MSIATSKTLKSYVLQELIGTGGFGAVYRAQQPAVGREVAIKIIWPAFASHPNFIRRFETEARLVARLEHPSIVPLYDYWRDPDGAYIVMRLLRGGHLGQFIEEQEIASLPVATRLIGQMAAGLTMAHRYDIVHRDIKPENILLDEQNNAYLADFGIAQIIDNARDDKDADIMAGMGSPAYAAPEQLEGHDTTSHSDIYSLGIVLYELLCGEHPFPELDELSMTDMLTYRRSKPVPSISTIRSDLPPTVDTIIQQATALDPAQRYTDVQALVLDLQRVLNQAHYTPVPAETIASSNVVLNPYRGLQAFQETDAGNFFGRKTLIQRLVRRLQETIPYQRFLAIVGPSGSGKSSVVRAGLVPALRNNAITGAGNWYYDDFSPGTDPFAELENTLNTVASEPPDDAMSRMMSDPAAFNTILNEVLPDDDTELFLFIDQFEEVFTLAQNQEMISYFLQLLSVAITAPDSRLRLVITIRADFYDRPLLQPGISEIVRERTEVIIPLTMIELERVIVEPARKAGVTIDSGLVGAIIAEVHKQPGSLPLLQYTLSELFEQRDNTQITSKHYRELGGVRGALARRADQIYESMTADEAAATRQLFLRLITPGEGTEDTRRRALMEEVTALHDDEHPDERDIINRVIQKLGTSRLITFDRDPATRSPTIEVAHEAIIREWQRLRNWLDESRNDLRLQRNLAVMAAEWENADRDASFLLRGARLESYQRWVPETSLALTGRETKYLNTSIQEHDKQQATEQRRQKREAQLEKQSVRRLRLLVIVLLVAMSGALVLTGFAFDQNNRANDARVTSDASALSSQSLARQSSARRALSEKDGDLAVVLALMASEGMANPPLQSISTLSEVALSPGTRRILTDPKSVNSQTNLPASHDAWVQAVAISPDMTKIISGSTDFSVKIWDVASGQLLHRLEGHGGDIEAVAFSPDNQTILSAAVDFDVILWDAETGERLRTLSGHTRPVRSVAYHPVLNQAISGSTDNTIILWNLDTGEIIQRLDGHNATVNVVTFSPDGKLIVSGANDSTLILWDSATDFNPVDLPDHNSAITDIDFTVDGQYMATSSSDGMVRVWEVTKWQIIGEFPGSPQEVRSITFTPDSDFIFVADISGSIFIRDVTTGLEVDRLEGHDDGILSLAMSADGTFAASGSRDRTIRIWNTGNPAIAMHLKAPTNRTGNVFFSSDNQYVYTGSADNTVRRWQISTGVSETILTADDAVLSMAINPNEQTGLIGLRDGRIIEFDLQNGDIKRTFFGHDDAINAIIYNYAGTGFFSASADGLILHWSLGTGDILQRFEGHTAAVTSLSLDPDNERLASTGRDQQVIIWNIETAVAIHKLQGHDTTVYTVKFSPDGNLLASGSRDTRIILWDTVSGNQVNVLSDDNDIIWSIDFNHNGREILAGTGNGELLIWNVDEGAIFQRYKVTSQDPIFAVSASPDGRFAATGMGSGDILLWYTFTADELIKWTRQNRYNPECVSFSIYP